MLKQKKPIYIVKEKIKKKPKNGNRTNKNGVNELVEWNVIGYSLDINDIAILCIKNDNYVFQLVNEIESINKLVKRNE